MNSYVLIRTKKYNGPPLNITINGMKTNKLIRMNKNSSVLDSTEYLKQLKYSSKYIRNKVSHIWTEVN